MKHRIGWLIGLLLAGGCLVLWGAGVRHRLTPDDVKALESVLGTSWTSMHLADSSYEAQVLAVRRLQELSHGAMRKDPPMPLGIHRSASTVLRHGGGWCYDYSYWYEEALRAVGMKTRHVALYQKQGSAVKTLLTPQGLSHAGTEVLTQKGWMFVEPSINLIWQDSMGAPLDVQGIVQGVSTGYLTLDQDVLRELYPLYAHDFMQVYGLYSRHGRFYKPFLPLPDVHWREFLYNLP